MVHPLPARAQSAVWAYVTARDPRNAWFGSGRTIIALGSLSVLLFAPIQALLVPVGSIFGPQCTNIRAMSLLCIGDPGGAHELRRWIMIAILVVVASGYRPRWTAIPHAWVTLTLATSIMLPDGGDAIALTISLLLLPIALIDDRRWHWTRPSRRLPTAAASIAVVFSLAIRWQIAFIYLSSALTKFAVDDWTNGTAEYYIARGTGFGDGGIFSGLVLWFTATPIGAIGMTWGALLIEIAIGLGMLLSERWRLVALVLDVVLHVGIIFTMGLWSFSMIMMGSAALAANPARAQPEHGCTESRQRRIAGTFPGRVSDERPASYPERAIP